MPSGGRRAVDARGAVGPLAAVDDLVPLCGRRARVLEDGRRRHRPPQGAVRPVDDVVLGRAPPVDRPDGRLRPLDAVVGLGVAKVVAVWVLLALRFCVARHLVVAGVVESVASAVVQDGRVQGEASLPGLLHLDHRLRLDPGPLDPEPDASRRLPRSAEGVGPRHGVAGLDQAPVDEDVLLCVQLLPDHQGHESPPSVPSRSSASARRAGAHSIISGRGCSEWGLPGARSSRYASLLRLPHSPTGIRGRCFASRPFTPSSAAASVARIEGRAQPSAK